MERSALHAVLLPVCACALCFVNTARSLELALFCHKYVSASGKGVYELFCVVCTLRTVKRAAISIHG